MKGPKANMLSNCELTTSFHSTSLPR